MSDSKKFQQTADLLFEISSLLMVSGANTSRINISIDRFASVLNFDVQSWISQKTIIMTLTDEVTKQSTTKVYNLPPHALSYLIISEISKSSWTAIHENWSLEEIEAEIKRIKELEKYPKIVVLFAVSFAIAGFCNLFKGDYLNMLVAFISAFVGLFVAQQAHRLKYNMYIRIFLASLVASLIASIGMVFNIGANPQTAVATSILFLVPGVTLINSFTDLLEGNILNGVVRFAMGAMTVLAIATGLFIAMYVFSINKI
ncbi:MULTISPECIES: threonine/serine exporter ThrE family protein [unclassified Algibacter]|uniref:threonine/serine ThrE exporter family protein n=1 Tax=unclassified Algibacter TaxID=2615009 RepID=UPI00131CF761|nr:MULTISPECIES: threonine/serine exporter family protein [unclassified Algibacter]MCL5128254.1 threonine/serine exporter family protein [Algibacter sp. L4_22]